MIEPLAFTLLAGVLLTSGVAILLTRDIVRSAVWLLGALGAVAGLLFLLSANFLAAVQLVLYVGGVLVLIVFGVMLTAKSPLRFAVKRREAVAAAGVGLLLAIGMLSAIFGGTWPEKAGITGSAAAPVREIGRQLLTTYLLPFELVSVLLLAVLIGAALLARPERR